MLVKLFAGVAVFLGLTAFETHSQAIFVTFNDLALFRRTQVFNLEQAGIRLGPAFAPFDPSGGGDLQKDMRLALPQDRLADRRSLLAGLDRVKWALGEGRLVDRPHPRGDPRRTLDVLEPRVGARTDEDAVDPRARETGARRQIHIIESPPPDRAIEPGLRARGTASRPTPQPYSSIDMGENAGASRPSIT